jgi:hypothetical protein
LVGPAAKGRWLGGMVACGAGNEFFIMNISLILHSTE